MTSETMRVIRASCPFAIKRRRVAAFRQATARGVWFRLGLFFQILLFQNFAGAAVPPGLLVAIHRDEAGVVQLDLADPFQGSVTVERSLDLSAWQPLATVSLAERSAVFTDELSPPGAAFYRLAPPLLDFSGNPTVSFEQAGFTVPEAAATVNLPVLRRGPLDAPLEVAWSLMPDGATPGQDYEADSGVIHFAPGANHAMIPLRIKDDTDEESDEAVHVVLSPTGVTATPYATTRVVIADSNSTPTTIVANAGLNSTYWMSDAGSAMLVIDQGRLYWNGPSDRRILSFAEGDLVPRIEATAFGTSIQVAAAGPWLVRLEAADGIAPGGCTGSGVMGKLVRSALDGSNLLILARPSLCGAVPPPVATAEAVFYVDTEASPDLYHLWRVSINGGVAQPLLTLTRPIKSMLVAGPWLWCFEDGFPDPENQHSALWRVAIDGSGAEVWISGLRAHAGQLVRDENFLYLADTSYGGVERIHRISPVGKTSQVLWEAEDLTGMKAVHSLTLTAGQLFWLDHQSLRVMPATGGAARTVVEGIEFPGTIAAGPVGVSWSQGSRIGQIRSYDPASGTIATRVEEVRDPGPLLCSGETLIFTKGVGYDEGGGQIMALPVGSTIPVPVAGGVSVQQPEFAKGGGAVHLMDQWTLKRLDGAGQQPVIVKNTTVASTGFTADATSVYWATEPEGIILAANHDGTQLRILATAGGRPISLHVDGNQLFWIDEPSRLRSIPIAGGGITDVLTGAGGISSYLVDGQYAFVALQDSGILVRVPRTGGTPTLLTGIPSFEKTVLAQTDNTVLWTTSNSIRSIPKAGGVSQPVVEGLDETPSAIATDGLGVFWLEATADRIRAAALPE